MRSFSSRNDTEKALKRLCDNPCTNVGHSVCLQVTYWYLTRRLVIVIVWSDVELDPWSPSPIRTFPNTTISHSEARGATVMSHKAYFEKAEVFLSRVSSATPR
jgi:hypothetical protein